MDKRKSGSGIIETAKSWVTTAFHRARPAAADPAAPDPTKILFPVGEPRLDFANSDLLLSTRLENSAQDMVRRSQFLNQRANRLVTTIANRADAEVTLGIQGFRFVIGLVWLGVAGWLYVSGLDAQAEGVAALSNGMPVGDAHVLSRTFLIVAAAGMGVAMAVGSLVSFSGDADNGKIRREAEQLGFSIADTSRDFDDALTAMRREMDRRGNPADAVVDLSRAHLTALEACAYFHEIAFLTGKEGEEALRLFKGFLRRPAPPVPPLPVLLIGFFLGALIVYVGYVPRPEPVTTGDAAPLALAQYPWALQLLLGGGFLYAIAGVGGRILGGLFESAAAVKAREDALDALRGAFTSRELPRPADVIRRIEDAVDVFRARVGGRRPGVGVAEAANQSPAYAAQSRNEAAASRFDDPDLETPAWRRRDSSVKFVETSFDAAPKSWRTDAYANFLAKRSAPDTGAKRDRKGAKKRSAD